VNQIKRTELFLQTASPEETYALGQKLAPNLKGGEVICLQGELGAGKTLLAKGIARGLGLQEEITSPTFTLVQEYPLANGLRLIHMDLYRLVRPEEAEVIGVADYFQNETVCLIEWPQVAEKLLPEDYWEIHIAGSGDLPREIRLSYPTDTAKICL